MGLTSSRLLYFYQKDMIGWFGDTQPLAGNQPALEDWNRGVTPSPHPFFFGNPAEPDS